jgi:hypothetical protein
MCICDMQFITYCLLPVHNTMPIQVLAEMDIGRTVRKAMKKFATVIDDTQDRLSHDEIIHACSVSTPSIIGIDYFFSLLVVFVVFCTFEFNNSSL